MKGPLFAADEPPPYEVVNRKGPSRAIITCDHASNRIPRRLGNLGLAPGYLQMHIAWDIGAAVVAQRLAEILDAPLVRSNYSRLVIDLNRPLFAPSSIPPLSEVVVIPGNKDLGADDAKARADALFRPYHGALSELIEERLGRPRLPVYVAIHSFTRVYMGEARYVDVCVAWRRDERLARLLLPRVEALGPWHVVANDPFVITPQGDYGIPYQAEARGIPCVMIELRQDLIEREDEARAWGERLAGVIAPVLDHPSLDERRPPPDDLPPE